MIKKLLLFSSLIAAFSSCCKSDVVADYQIVPLPQQITAVEGNGFVITPNVAIVADGGNEELLGIGELLSADIKRSCGYGLNVVAEAQPTSIVLKLDDSIERDEEYKLVVDGNGVTITGASVPAVFYGAQTLYKSIPAQCDGANVVLPAVEISDYPRFSYRGVMIDVARHFRTIDELETIIDMLALHNLNKLHLHLTDDQGWRIEIKKYPELTTIGSKRAQTVIGRNSGEYDGKPYGEGCFYTQEEMKALIEYAAARQITIVPEIDLPGHQLAALTAYPDLGCSGGPYKVWEHWGVSEDVICAGNEKAMLFLEDVLAEVIDLFPSEFIHIGGDECPKSMWAKCPKCQARIKKLGIRGSKEHSAEEYLQSYVITRMSNFVESKGRKMIGWDEILEGGLAPNAIVMSWRGSVGGIAAAQQGNDVVMTPNTHLYFDYYQSSNVAEEPLAIGGFVSVERVYGFEPVPAELTAEEGKHIIGLQGNLWSEYMPEFDNVTYMLLPRLAALAEVQWLEADKKDYNDFLTRTTHMTEYYAQRGLKYAKHIFDVQPTINADRESGKLTVGMSMIGEGEIRYTLDGSEPTIESTLYTEPVAIDKTCTLKAIAVRGSEVSGVYTENFVYSISTARPISLRKSPNKRYEFDSANVLNDGLKGGMSFGTGHWIGFLENDVEAVIDLLAPQTVSKVSVTTQFIPDEWILDGKYIIVKVSDDGENFKQVAKLDLPAVTRPFENGIHSHVVEFEAQETRYVEVDIANSILPEWHGAAGQRAFLFVDEITVE